MNLTTRVGRIAFDRVTMEDATHILSAYVRQGKFHPKYVCTGNLDHLRLAENDEQFAEAYANADLVLADGMPIVWLSKLTNAPLPERVAGSDLVWKIAKISSESGARVFLLGGNPGSAVGAMVRMKAMYPHANFVGTYCPPHALFDTREEQEKIKAAVRGSRPDILLVAFGAPKQEKWIAANLNDLDVPLTIGVGGSFEMAAGAINRAPVFFQKSGLEWFWRFCQEPNRLFDRYFKKGIPFLTRLSISMLSKKFISIFGSEKPYCD